MGRERILTECEGNFLRWRDSVQFVMSTSLYQLDTCLTIVNGVTFHKTVTFTVTLLSFVMLHTAKCVWTFIPASQYSNVVLEIAKRNQNLNSNSRLQDIANWFVSVQFYDARRRINLYFNFIKYSTQELYYILDLK